MRKLPDRKTLNGKFDAYCHVCWNAVYCLWIDDADPAGKCPFGHTSAKDCPDARAAAENAASVIKAKRDAGMRETTTLLHEEIIHGEGGLKAK